MDQETTDLLARAVDASERGDHRLGEQLSTEALRRAERLDDPALTAAALAQLAQHQARLGKLVTAAASGRGALAHCPDNELTAQIAHIHNDLSWTYERAGLQTLAMAHATKALEVARLCHDPAAECRALNRLGTADAHAEGGQRGLDTLAQAVALARRLALATELFAALNNLSRRWVVEADRLVRLGEDPRPALLQALPLAEEASQLPTTALSAFQAATSMANLAGVHRRLGHWARAQTHFSAALGLARHHGYAGLAATLELAMTCMALEQSPSPQARQAVQRLIDAEPAEADPDLLIEARRMLMRGYRESGDLSAALVQMEHLNEALLAAQARRVDLQSRLLFQQNELDQVRLKAAQARHDAQLQRLRADSEHQLATQLARTRDQLEQEVAARTLDLQHAKAAAEAASRAKSSFLSTVSHELHTPLNGLIGMVELVRRGTTEPKQAERMRKATDAAWQLNALFDNILDFVAADADAPAVATDTTLRTLLDGCCLKRTTAALLKDLTIEVDVAPDLPARLHLDGSRVSRILDALLDNAIKFSTQGPIRLQARAEAGTDGQRQLLLNVSDRGPGVPPDVVERLFRPFEMGDDSLTRAHRGLGLGLALAQRLARTLGGQVGVDTPDSGGSSFWLRIALVEA